MTMMIPDTLGTQAEQTPHGAVIRTAEWNSPYGEVIERMRFAGLGMYCFIAYSNYTPASMQSNAARVKGICDATSSFGCAYITGKIDSNIPIVVKAADSITRHLPRITVCRDAYVVLLKTYKQSGNRFTPVLESFKRENNSPNRYAIIPGKLQTKQLAHYFALGIRELIASGVVAENNVGVLLTDAYMSTFPINEEIPQI